MKRTVVLLVCLTMGLSPVHSGQKEDEVEKDFQDIWERYLSNYEDIPSANFSCLTFFAPEAKEFEKLGVAAVPYMVEKIRSYKKRGSFRDALQWIATALLLGKPIMSDDVRPYFDKHFGKGVLPPPDKWLKWWEEEGKKLYEKRMKELGEKEKAPEKPETQEPNELPEEEPPPLKSKPQPEPEKAQPPAEPSKAKPDVQKPPFEKLPESAENVSTDEPESQPQSANWLLLGLAAMAILLAGIVIVFLCRKHKTV